MSLDSHKHLCDAACQQLRKRNCNPIVSEMVAAPVSGEIPDAAGWVAHKCILFECKTSRTDFLRDRSKLFRYDLPDSGVGCWRVDFCVHDLDYGLSVIAKSAGAAKFVAYKEWLRICDYKGFSEPTCGEFLRYCKVREEK